MNDNATVGARCSSCCYHNHTSLQYPSAYTSANCQAFSELEKTKLLRCV